MNTLQISALAVLQGITEFLPISSSGHLVLMQHFFGLRDVPVFFDLVLHLGTTAAVVAVYYRFIGEILYDLIKWPFSQKRNTITEKGTARLFFYIALSTGITGILGILFKDFLTQFFYKPGIVPVFLFCTGGILLGTRFLQKGEVDIRTMRTGHAAVIGTVQAIAMLPGISRSGTTISAGLYLGMTREFSGAFSFLLSIPSVLGASLFEYFQSGASRTGFGLLSLGFALSFATGFIALKLLLTFLRRGTLHIFSYYCFAAALTAFIVMKTGGYGG